jgi:proline iminopeptidase
MLDVSSLHSIHVEESGNPNGKPALFLHGGPGGGIEPIYRQYFDPEKWRLILIDQRGCGKSLPFAELEENTTWELVEDIEKVREYLGIKNWVVFGGSWGSTLSLAYAETYPDRVIGLILRGIFMLRKKELQWFYQEGASEIYPDAFEHYVKPILEEDRDDFLHAFYKRLTSKDRMTRLEAAKAWSIWEGATSKLYADSNLVERFGKDKFAEAFARIECHYFVNGGWFNPEDQLLRDINKIRHIPAVIIQGRYDVVCPATSAWELHKAWPEADFHIVQDAGHSMSEPGIRSKLIEATEKFATL